MLQVPLQARNYSINGKEVIDLWHNGERKIIPAPIRPYIWSLRPLDLHCDCQPRCYRSCLDVEVEKTTVRPLSNLKPTKAWKYSFGEVDAIRRINKQIPDNHFIRENHLSFIERVATDAPDFFTQFPENLSSLICLDIETLSNHGNYTEEIIALSISDGTETWCHTGNESDILHATIKDFQRINPDIVIGYNLKNFDLPVILRRCALHSLSTSWMGRDHQKQRLDAAGRVHRIVGRTVFDVWESVWDDQTLMGKVKDRKLKTVARYRGIDAIQEETSNTAALLKDIDRLVRYCNSDVDATLELYNGYIHQTVAIANYLRFPFEELVNTKGSKRRGDDRWDNRAKSGISTLISRLIIVKGMVERGFIESGLNREIYPEVYASEGKDFQGGYVKSWQNGLFHNILHIDFASMYPSIVTSLNISPETVHLVDEEPYDQDAPFLRSKDSSTSTYCVADNNWLGGRNLIIEVDTSFIGCLTHLVDETAKLRAEYKLEMDKHEPKSAGYTRFYSSQWGMKVLPNASSFGTLVPRSTRYGNLVAGALIPGTARHLLRDIAIPYLKDEWDIDPIECDTDGVHNEYGEPEFPHDIIDGVNRHIKKHTSQFAVRNDIRMEGTMWKDAFFRDAMKAYVLRGRKKQQWDSFNDELKLTGSTLTDSKRPLFIDNIRDSLIDLVLAGAPRTDVQVLLKESMRIGQYSIKQLQKTVTMGQPLVDYLVNSEAKQVALMAQRLLQIKPRQGNSYAFVYGPKKQKILSQLATVDQLDQKKYRKMVKEVADLFGYADDADLYYQYGSGSTKLQGRGAW